MFDHTHNCNDCELTQLSFPNFSASNRNRMTVSRIFSRITVTYIIEKLIRLQAIRMNFIHFSNESTQMRMNYIHFQLFNP